MLLDFKFVFNFLILGYFLLYRIFGYNIFLESIYMVLFKVKQILIILYYLFYRGNVLFKFYGKLRK